MMPGRKAGKTLIRAGLTAAVLLVAACATPESAQPVQYGLGLLAAEDYAAAKAHFSALRKKYPADPYVALNLGVALQQLGENEQAAEMYRVAIEAGENAPVHLTVNNGDRGRRFTNAAELARENLAGLKG